jgi:hypothetical protein
LDSDENINDHNRNIFETENLIPSDNSIIIEKINLKPERSAFYSPHYNLRAEIVSRGQISVYLTYGLSGEEYYLIQKGVHGKIIQVPTEDKKFRKLLRKLILDNAAVFEQIDINKVDYFDLLEIINRYNSFYQ